MTTDEETVESLRLWWKENGPWILGGIALGAVLLFGWRYWTEWRETQLAHASEMYEQLVAEGEAGDLAHAATIASELRALRLSNPYADLGAMALARHAAVAGDLDLARTQLEELIERSSDRHAVHVARIRLARLELADERFDRAAELLQVREPGRFAPLYAELRGDLAAARGDTDAALAAYRDALEGAEDGIADRAMIEMKLDNLGASAPAQEA